jgi:RNA 3'-phosphate cyclase
MVRIDGSKGEGGGQVLRSSLTLSLLTGKPFRIDRIRVGRRNPGLMPQHLQAVKAAAAIGRGKLEGALPGSMTLLFEPGPLRPGEYHFDIGTAGSTSLVLQTIFLPLALARQPSELTLIGGTHVAWSPSFHYLEMNWLYWLRRVGFKAILSLDRAGFYPRGGGRIKAEIYPANTLSPMHLFDRGNLAKVRILSVVSNLDPEIGRRQSSQALRRLGSSGISGEIGDELRILPAAGKGTMLLLLAEFDRTRCCYFSLGERGKPAETVANEAVDQFLAFLDSGGVVDQFLADQLLLPLALVPGESEMLTSVVTSHLLTNAEVLRRFLPVEIRIEGAMGHPGLVRIGGLNKGFALPWEAVAQNGAI